MDEVTKKIERYMSKMMGMTMSIILSTYGTIMSGKFMISRLAISLAFSLVLTSLIGRFIPVRKIGKIFSRNIFSPLLTTLVDNAVITTIYVCIVSTIMTFSMTKFATFTIEKQIDKAKLQIEMLDETTNIEEIEELKFKIEGMEKAKLNLDPIKQLPKSLMGSYILSYIISLVVQPLYLNKAFKKAFGVNKPIM